MRWEIEKRLEFIESRLYWEGTVNRKNITERFGISVPQASADLKKYQEIAPENIQYDNQKKQYLASLKFKPALINPRAEDYLTQLSLIGTGVLQNDETYIGNIPHFDMIPSFKRAVDNDVFRSIIKAIHTKNSLEIKYQSMSRPDPVWRWVAPHAFGSNDSRWHIRAFCHINNDYRDFNLGRILEIKGIKRHDINFLEDRLWHKYISIVIVPHPGLSESQKKIIERDYGMKNSIAVINVRAALIFYLIKNLGLHPGHEENDPEKQQVILLNRDEVYDILHNSSKMK